MGYRNVTIYVDYYHQTEAACFSGIACNTDGIWHESIFCYDGQQETEAKFGQRMVLNSKESIRNIDSLRDEYEKGHGQSVFAAEVVYTLRCNREERCQLDIGQNI